MTSKKRSGEYYGSDVGRKKKREHNAARTRRRENGPLVPESPQVASSTAALPPSAPSMPVPPMALSSPADFKESVIQYTRLIMTHTEGRKVSRDEALATLRGVVRQRSLDST